MHPHLHSFDSSLSYLKIIFFRVLTFIESVNIIHEWFKAMIEVLETRLFWPWDDKGKMDVLRKEPD